MDGTSRIDELEQKFIENPRRFFAPLANEYRKAGNPHQAIAICRAHLSQLPGHMSGQIVYGQALFEGGEYEQARTVFETALAMDRENLIALRHLGDLALREGETVAAKQWYEKLLEVDPKDAAVVALVNEIDAATEAQPPAATDADQTGAEAAQAIADETTAESAGSAAPPVTPAVDHFHSDEEDKLLSEELGYPVPPPQAFVTETMAELYLAQGFRDRAVNVFRQLVALRPDEERLRARLAELEASAAAPEAVPASALESPEPPPPEVATAVEMQLPEPEPAVEEPALIEARHEVPELEEPAHFPPPGEQPVAAEASAAITDSADAPSEEPRTEPKSVAAPLTVRDFFASIGRRRPSSPTNGSASGESSLASMASGSNGSSSSDDARAAAALAGAFGQFSGGTAPALHTPSSLAPVAPGKESEEDVASFRAWLDGLTG